MLARDRGERYRDASEAAEAMRWVSQEPDADLCRAMMEQRVVPAMRALFLRHWAEQEGEPWANTPEYGKRYMEREVATNRRAANWLIRERLAAGDTGSWDATALCTILLWSQVRPHAAPRAAGVAAGGADSKFKQAAVLPVLMRLCHGPYQNRSNLCLLELLHCCRACFICSAAPLLPLQVRCRNRKPGRYLNSLDAAARCTHPCPCYGGLTRASRDTDASP
jgi:hypothetical protein